MTQPTYMYFYGHHGKRGWLSNFYEQEYVRDGKTFYYSEQDFMKIKQETFDPDNDDLAYNIMNVMDPLKIKDFGRQVKNYDDEKWNKIRYKAMVTALMGKFSVPELKEKLLKTNDHILVEASPYDTIWGIGINEETARNGGKWRGQNLLGKALMEVRTNLRNLKK